MKKIKSNNLLVEVDNKKHAENLKQKLSTIWSLPTWKTEHLKGSYKKQEFTLSYTRGNKNSPKKVRYHRLQKDNH